jgi:uncharacterized phiE125 gp8 family phage protein
MYGLTVTTGPTIEPITRALAKEHCEIPAADSQHDTYIDALITAAREHYERRTHRALINRTLALTLDRFPDGNVPLWLPWSPISSVTSIVYTDTNGTPQTWANSNYAVQKNIEPGRVVLAYDKQWPSYRLQASGITVTYVAGYGAAASSVPANAVHALKLLIRHWFENRSAINIGNIVNDIPLAYESLTESARVGDEFICYGQDQYAA